MNLLEVARILKNGSGISRRDFLELVNHVVPVEELPNLTAEDAEAGLSFITYLFDYFVLAHEKRQLELGNQTDFLGAPALPGPSGPFIYNVLTRGFGAPPDFTALETFGFEEADDDDQPD